MDKEELGTYNDLREWLADKLEGTPNLWPYTDFTKLLDLAADVASAEEYEPRVDAVEELRSFLI